MRYWVLGGLLTLAACGAVAGVPETPISQPATHAGEYGALGRPYLGGALPGGSALVPPAPTAGDAIQIRDDTASEAGLALTGTPRWTLAAQDASLREDAPGRAFSCSAGIAIGKDNTPALARLLSRATTDLALSTHEVKALYARPRPFMVNDRPTCTPDAEAQLRDNGSYPSGHSAIGYGLSLILAEIIPDKAAVLVARGREFGESRRICNVHWKSDIEEGRQVAAATIARLHSDTEFIADIAAAKAEVAMPLAGPDASRCEAEAAALALGR